MDMPITKASQNAYYHLHNIRRIRKFLSQEATCTIIHAFITSQIDYSYSLMNGLPENLIKKLQRVQNTAARLVFNLRKYDHPTPALVTLHWLPVKYWIEFKTLLIVLKGLHGKAPTCIQEMITPSTRQNSIQSVGNMPPLPPCHLFSHVLQIMPRNPKYDQFQSKWHHNEENPQSTTKMPGNPTHFTK